MMVLGERALSYERGNPVGPMGGKGGGIESILKVLLESKLRNIEKFGRRPRAG
jgi:hypothetical protein